METVKFTANEIAVLKAIYETGQHEFVQYYMVEDLVSHTGKSVNAIKGILSSLRKKGVIYAYAGEYAFDGEIREDAEELVKSILNNVNPQNNETENNMENNENPNIDERIVRINEILSTKLNSITKSKRESIKAAKVAAKFILENWDNVNNLKNYTDDEECKQGQYELWCIAKSRLDQLTYVAPEPETKETSENDETTSETTHATAETPKADKTTTANKTARSKHVVGDVHPNGKWVWTEYQPGKFDWRVIPKNGTTPKQTKKKSAAALKDKVTKTKKQAEKSVKVRTIEEILATKPIGMSAPQERAFKLLRKGYRIDPNTATPQGYTLIKDGKTMVIIEGVMNALMSRMKVTPDEINQFKA